MNELFNFHDSWIVVEQNWWLVLGKSGARHLGWVGHLRPQH